MCSSDLCHTVKLKKYCIQSCFFQAIVVNTCCFINDAKEESVNTILEMAEYKKTGSCKVLVVTGCMAQRYKNEIIEEVPEVDAVLGTTSYGDILKAIREAMEGKHFQEFKDIDYLPEKLGKRVLTEPSPLQGLNRLWFFHFHPYYL